MASAGATATPPAEAGRRFRSWQKAGQLRAGPKAGTGHSFPECSEAALSGSPALEITLREHPGHRSSTGPNRAWSSPLNTQHIGGFGAGLVAQEEAWSFVGRRPALPPRPS